MRPRFQNRAQEGGRRTRSGVGHARAGSRARPRSLHDCSPWSRPIRPRVRRASARMPNRRPAPTLRWLARVREHEDAHVQSPSAAASRRRRPRPRDSFGVRARIRGVVQLRGLRNAGRRPTGSPMRPRRLGSARQSTSSVQEPLQQLWGGRLAEQRMRLHEEMTEIVEGQGCSPRSPSRRGPTPSVGSRDSTARRLRARDPAPHRRPPRPGLEERPQRGRDLLRHRPWPGELCVLTASSTRSPRSRASTRGARNGAVRSPSEGHDRTISRSRVSTPGSSSATFA